MRVVSVTQSTEDISFYIVVTFICSAKAQDLLSAWLSNSDNFTFYVQMFDLCWIQIGRGKKITDMGLSVMFLTRGACNAGKMSNKGQIILNIMSQKRYTYRFRTKMHENKASLPQWWLEIAVLQTCPPCFLMLLKCLWLSVTNSDHTQKIIFALMVISDIITATTAADEC